MKLLIIGDPSGLHTLLAIKKGFKPENITVWENDERHIYSIQQINNSVTIVKDLTLLLINYMKYFDVTLGNPPFQDGSNTDKASRLWNHFWAKCLYLTKDDGIVSLITPTTWCSPSKDFKGKHEGYEGDIRLWDTFNRFTTIADIDSVKQYFPGVGSTFGRVTVYKSGNEGLSFTNGYSTHLGFLPKSGDIDEIFSMIDKEENLKKYFKMDQEHRYGLKVGIPTTRGFINNPDMIQILKGDEVGTSGSVDPRNYYYIYVDNDEQAQMIKDMIMNAAEMLCTHCRWAGYLNLKMVEYLKYNPESDGKE